MASGSFNINTFSRYGELPLANTVIPYSSLTMFAVGKNSLLSPYSFYDYTNASGFMDTSTMQTVLQSSIVSTIRDTPKTFVSTIPYTKWVSSTTVQTNPLYYTSTFQLTTSTIPVSVQATYRSTFVSTIYPPPTVLYPSSTPVYPNPFLSTIPYLFQSTIPYFVSTSRSFGPIVSTGVLAASYPFDFVSSYSGTSVQYPYCIQTSNVWLGDTMSQYINSKQYNVFVNCQYSLWLSTSTTPYSWIDTTGYFGTGNGIVGQTCRSRVGDSTYTQITNTFMYNPEPLGYQTQIGPNTSNFSLSICIRSTIQTTSSNIPSFDIFIPGNNNFTITLVPI